MKKIIAMLLTLAMVFALTACGSKPAGDSGKTPDATQNTPSTSEPPPENTVSEVSGEPIKIGHIVDLQGSEALTGEEARKALQFAADHFGNIAGRPVEIIVADAQGTANGAVDAARNLVEREEVIALMGPTQAGQKAAVAEYVKEAKIPLIYYSGTPAYLFYGNEWLIGAGGANPQMTIMADYAYNDLGYRRVHTITMDNIGFKGFTDDFAAAFTALGGEIVSDQYAPLDGSVDWAPYLITLEDADAIMAWSTGSNAISLWQNWYDLGINQKMPMQGVMGSAFTDYYILNALNNVNPETAAAVLGAASPTAYSYDVSNAENEAFVEAWSAKFGVVPQTNLPGQCYQAFQLLKTAIESIDGNTEAEAVRNAILACDITGPTGRLAFEGTSVGTKDMYIVEAVQMNDGTYNYQIVKTYHDVSPNGMLP